VSELERDLVALAHDFAEREIRPVARHHDETEEFPWEVHRKAAEIGLTCFDLPETFGGGGVESVLAQCLISEELSWGDGPIANAITSNGFFAGPILRMGTEEQRERWVRPLTGPEPPLCGLAITEPETGSDASAIAGAARPGATHDPPCRTPGRRPRAVRHRVLDGQALGVGGRVVRGVGGRGATPGGGASRASTPSRSGCATPSWRRSGKARATSNA